MKHIFKLAFATIVVASLFSSCKKDENKIFYEGGTAPTLTASSTSAITLLPANQSDVAMKFNWTNPNYKFTTGVSSQDVYYTLQVDTTGANFSSPNKQEVSIPRELGTSFTVKELNAVFSKLDVAENMPHNIEFRIKASLGNNSVPLYSNVIKRVITPYLDVAVPVPVGNELWATGDAFASGYANPLTGNYVIDQKFKRVSSSLYELDSVSMVGGGAYKLIQINGDWSTQYHMLTGGTWSGGEFEKKDSDPGFPGPPSAGNYKITVNFKTGKYTVVKL